MCRLPSPDWRKRATIWPTIARRRLNVAVSSCLRGSPAGNHSLIHNKKTSQGKRVVLTAKEKIDFEFTEHKDYRCHRRRSRHAVRADQAAGGAWIRYRKFRFGRGIPRRGADEQGRLPVGGYPTRRYFGD